ncbi:OLC1v1013375C1 [Oldenlandia corymbosa var. corymbosa]|uniref:Non-specific lipid-transfer protein n=1 Tax=Oldenlandia corymbosa var. corymbosa TaxID=529605 RepID=A0AAV1DYA8_OLDCO|nr:OLC1v1013375C1 [Oldenlandia corymbosa var. corymbosa]
MANQKIATLALCLGTMILTLSYLSYGEIPCETVLSDLTPCLGFVIGGGETVDPACCSGFKTVIGSAKTKPDRQSVCTCLKSLASEATDAELANAARIPKLCGVKVPFKISRDIDCSKVKLH